MPTNIGFLINDERLSIETVLTEIERLDCGWVMVATSPQQANEIAAAIPDLRVVYHAQWFPDETPQSFCQRVSPEQYIEQMLALDLAPDIVWSSLYEPENYALAADWLIAAMNLADQVGRRLVVGNFNAGTLDARYWHSSLRPLLERLAGSWHILGMHEMIVHDLNLNLEHQSLCSQIIKDACTTLGIAYPQVMITEYDLSLDDEEGSASLHNPEVLAQSLWETYALYALCNVPALLDYSAVSADVRVVLAALEWPKLIQVGSLLPPADAWQPVLIHPQAGRSIVRARPHPDGAEMTTLQDVVLAECINTGHSWWRIKYGASSGWFCRDEVQLETAASPVVGQDSTSDQRIVNLENENTALRVEIRNLRSRLQQIAGVVGEDAMA